MSEPERDGPPRAVLIAALLIAVAAAVAVIAIAALIFLNQSHKGQFDDLDTPARRVLFDEDEKTNKS